MISKLKSNDKAPQFSLQDQFGKKVKLSDFKGKKVLLYFYPKADTSGCTTQACSIRDAEQDLDRLGLNVLGISPDPPQRLTKFDQKHSLGFPLLSDPEGKVAKAYSAWGEKSMYGKKYEGIIRSSFLLDEKARVLHAWYKVSPKNTVPYVLEALEGSLK